MKDIAVEIMEDIDKRLDAIPLEELPRIYDEVNCWRWVAELGEQPDNHKEHKTCPETAYLRQEIKFRCGNKAILRYIMTEKENYTPQMFEDWWDSTFPFGEESDEIRDRLREQDCSKQSCNGENYVKNMLFFMLGFFGAILCLLFVKLCT